MSVQIFEGDCRRLMVDKGPFDMIVADPPYGDTSLGWDERVSHWHKLAAQRLKSSGSIWVFGSLRYFMAEEKHFAAAGLRVAQEVVWEKHNGSGFHADRFKRVHELVVQFYRSDAPWREVYNKVQTTPDATAKVVRRKTRPPHMGNVDAKAFVSEDGGPRIMRSVIYARSPRSGRHPTEKPIDLLEVLIRTSCPPGGLVGDFFAGCGSAGDAASLTGRNYVGCEIDPNYAEIARTRLASRLPLICAE